MVTVWAAFLDGGRQRVPNWWKQLARCHDEHDWDTPGSVAVTTGLGGKFRRVRPGIDARV